MIRITVRTDDAGMVAAVGGGAVLTQYKSFDVEAPALEAFLRVNDNYTQRQIVSYEVTATEPKR
jgi:hypothetical protein